LLVVGKLEEKGKMRNMGFGYVGLKAVVKRMLGEVDVMVRKMIRGDEWRELKEYLLKFLVVRQKFKEKILDFLQGKFILEKFDYEFQEEFWGEANREKGLRLTNLKQLSTRTGIKKCSNSQ
jgi:hypothetical protein